MNCGSGKRYITFDNTPHLNSDLRLRELLYSLFELLPIGVSEIQNDGGVDREQMMEVNGQTMSPRLSQNIKGLRKANDGVSGSNMLGNGKLRMMATEFIERHHSKIW